MTAPKTKRTARREAAADRYAKRIMPHEVDAPDYSRELGIGATDAETIERVVSGRVRATGWEAL